MSREPRFPPVVHVVAETFLDLTPELRKLRDGFELPPEPLAGRAASDDRPLVRSRDFH